MSNLIVMRLTDEKIADEDMLVTQSNQLVEAKYYLSLYEQRLVLMLISMVEPDDKDFKDYVIKVSDFKNLIGIKTKNLYPKVKTLLRSLATKIIEIPKGGRSYLITGWISDAEYFDNEGVVKLSFSKKLKPYLIALKREFTSHKLGVAIKFKGVYTIRIYTLLKQYQRLGSRIFTVNDFREILGVEEDKYFLFADLKRRTITQAQKEFSQKDKNGKYLADINFDFEAIKTGRKITSIKLLIYKQEITTPVLQHREPTALQEEPKQESKIYLQMVQVGVTKTVARKLFVEFGENYIELKFALLIEDMSSGNVKNPASYLVKAIKENWTSEKGAKRKQEAEKKKAEELARFNEMRKKIKAVEEKTLADEFKVKALAEFLSSKSEEERKALLIKIKKNAGDFVGKMIDDLSHSLATPEILKQIPFFLENQKEYIKQNI